MSENIPNTNSLSNVLLNDEEIPVYSNLLNLGINENYIGNFVIVPNTDPRTSVLLDDVEIPEYDNLLETIVSLNDESLSNSGILEEYETVENIPSIPPGDGSVFPSDPALLPKIYSLAELLPYLSEIMIRFSSNPNYYMQSDFKLLIQVITNSLIYLYSADIGTSVIDSIWAELALKVDKVAGKSLTTNDLTDLLKTAYDIAVTHSQSAHAPADAEKNVNADWNATSGDAQILNKPLISQFYKFTQGIASTIWNITHGLGKYPSIVTTDELNNNYEGDVTYINENVVQIEFSIPINGYAYLN